MHFVQFTLNPPAAVVAAAYGSFSAPKEQEIVVARQGGALELLRPDEATGRLATCLLYTSPSPRDGLLSRMPSSA